MKIIFICGSLNPGKDGIGDYTRQIALELYLQKWECICFSLNETDIDDNFIAGQEESGVKYYRLSSNESPEKKVVILQQVINTFRPDICSIQLCIYGFHSRGWMNTFNHYYAPVLSCVNIHIMWHELWIGLLRNSSSLHRIEGMWQKKHLMKMLKILHPSVQHTTIPFYKLLLEKFCIKAKLLPLVSNFSLDKDDNFNLKAKLKLVEGNTGVVLFVCFGAIYDLFPFNQWLSEASQWREKNSKNIILCSLGRMGAGKKNWDKWALKVKEYDWIKMYAVGALQPAEVRSAFDQSDVGLSFTPLEGWGKSTSIAAMIESGLPVMGYKFGIAPKKINFKLSTPPGMIPLLIDVTNQWPQVFKRQATERKINTITNQFIADLTHAMKAATS